VHKFKLVEGGDDLNGTFELTGTCDMCRKEDCDVIYDARIPAGGTWAHMCTDCFEWYGCRTGIGRGQKYVKQPDVIAEIENLLVGCYGTYSQ